MDRIQRIRSAMVEAERMLTEVTNGTRESKSLSTHSITIWRAFSQLEYAVLLLKLHLKVENPGKVLKPPKLRQDLSEEIMRAREIVANAVDALNQQRYEESLKKVRLARDVLKEIQLVLRKHRKRAL